MFKINNQYFFKYCLFVLKVEWLTPSLLLITKMFLECTVELVHLTFWSKLTEAMMILTTTQV